MEVRRSARRRRTVDARREGDTVVGVPGHGQAFHAVPGHYPRTERAVGYLEGLAAGAGLDITED